MINKSYSGGMDVDYRHSKKIDDLTKALCYITGTNYDNVQGLEHWMRATKITDEDHYRNSEEIKKKAKSQYKHYSTHWEYEEKFNKKYKNEAEFVEHHIQGKVDNPDEYEVREFGKWYDWGFFEVKGFKKGTMHLKFKDEEVWKLFNKRVADIKGYVLPESLQPKTEKQTPQPEPEVNELGQLLLM